MGGGACNKPLNMERSRNSKSCCDMLNRCDENAQLSMS